MPVLGIVLAVLLTGVAGAAEPLPAGDATPSKWQFEVEPYGWIPGNFGTVTVKGHEAQIAANLYDVLKLLEAGNALAGAGYFSVSYDRFSLFADSFGGFAEESVSERIPTQFCTISVRARDKLTYVINDFALGFRLAQWSLPARRQPLTLGVYAGTRWMYFGNQLNASGGVVHGRQGGGTDVFESFSWADPLIGIRWSVPVLDSVSVGFRGDIGGFGASSKLIWGLVGDVRYWLSWSPWSTHPYLAVGYRAIDFDRSSSAGSINLQMRGPISGMGFVF